MHVFELVMFWTACASAPISWIAHELWARRNHPIADRLNEILSVEPVSFTPLPFVDTGTDPLWMHIVGIPVDVWMELKTPEDWSRAIWNREHGLWATRDGSHFFERTGRDVGTWQPEVFDQESNSERVSVYVQEFVEPVAEYTLAIP